MLDFSALILAGGRASRMGGVDKMSLVIEGESIFGRQTRVLAPLVREILVSSPREVDGYRTVRDVDGAIGPLAGIAAGLAVATTEWLLVVAGDMPSISTGVISLLLDRARNLDADDARAVREQTQRLSLGEVPSLGGLSDLVAPLFTFDAVAVRVGGRPEPLLSLLRVVPARRAANELIAQGQMRASGLLDALRVAWVEEDALRAVDPELRALRNVNTPADL